MAASLLIHTTPHTAIPPAHIDALLDAARSNHIDAAEKPRPFGAPFTRALELTSDAADIHALQLLMDMLRQWAACLKRDRAVDLTVRLLDPPLTIELTSPAAGSKQMAAVCADIVEGMRLLETKGLLRAVSRLLLTPEVPFCDVRADIGGNPAYLVDMALGQVRKAPGARDVPGVTQIR